MVLKPRPSSGEAQVEIAGAGRAARTIIPVPAPDYHVFEVTDLIIPAGTEEVNDFSPTAAYDLGALTIDPAANVLHSWYIEITANIATADETGNDGVGIQYGNQPWGGVLSSAIPIGQKNHAVMSMQESWQNAWFESPTPSSLTFRVQLFATHGGSGISTDIHVVRARAAFLVI